MVVGVSNMAPVLLTLQIVAFDPNDLNALGLGYIGAIDLQTARLTFDSSNNLKANPQTP